MELSLFSNPEVTINKKIRLLETFSGYGSQLMAMERIADYFGKDIFESYFSCEFDKYANSLFNAAHGTDYSPSDIRNIHAEDLKIVDKDKYCYLLTYSFPCTDLSVAGLQKGMSKKDWEEGKSTRSGLLWEVERILTECGSNLPDILLMENVTQVRGKKNMEDFSSWLKFLSSKGYSNFYQDLNSKNYGIPQNRDRTFMISILGEYDYEFPKEIPLDVVMADILEDEVDEKYFINNEKAEALILDLQSRGVIPGDE